MVATVRLDDALEKTLESLSSTLHKKKSDVIRDAITFYANTLETSKQTKLRNAIDKTKAADKRIYDDMDGTFSDGI
ncbi:MAG TPA: CopG family transcriptional regulator [Sulfurovum sp.]|jgi:predicted transcriptional regulator|nr:MAG: CopG family transcriptional regulator [Sulfurovum sp. 35-42-20]OYY56719.1 MAG: CopG family transcriptional regulator [Sulfurovum sp. 28-43-6]OYZ24821.1 MAG: CopG family transcriptional regulator [Sulfurovum sp. 16-42-52]OYZ49305.1 MAG: CopG family transcriptional regulator [Sulfurovum sp. 24-42-9]OZA44780.1 MAG: CopG family transcriptional regulator [Sulfurovum sp. 17-42-90]OZA59467.1 MAG: CopG family transcriptional regulator [Sulfurovum sp. 39-42-12]HQR73938.1 CopG family transcript